MNKQEKKRLALLKKQVKGITLIALVVTIIVLLILAAIAINLTIGNNGIFTRAKDALVQWNKATVNEEMAMNQIVDFIDGNNGGTNNWFEEIGNYKVLGIYKIKEVVNQNKDGGMAYLQFLGESKTDKSLSKVDCEAKFYIEENQTSQQINFNITKTEKVNEIYNGAVLFKGFILNNELPNDAYKIGTHYDEKSNYDLIYYARTIYKIIMQVEESDELTMTSWVEDYKNLEDILDKAQKHPDQSKTNSDIGIDKDGNPVNMDLWDSSREEGSGYNLKGYVNSATLIPAYKGSFNDNGEIEGTVPAYIKKEGDSDFIPVTNMYYTFAKCDELKIAPEIPDSVTSMIGTFSNCKNLTTAPYISEFVTQLDETFILCYNLTGTMTIDANPESYMQCFVGVATADGTNLVLTGSSTMLNVLKETAGSNSHITVQE